jgi:hypothetical protein
MVKLFIITCLLTVTAISYANEKICTKEEAIKAESESNSLKNWNSVYTSYKRFKHCDDGAISEGYSDSIGRLLAYDWKHINNLNKLTLRDKQFETFVIKHIDETVPVKYLELIYKNAKNNCPNNLKRFCNLIINATGLAK